MTSLNQGRNEIAVPNSNANCLLENWVEERAVSYIDPSKPKDEDISVAKLFKDGHKGLLTTEMDAKQSSKTEVRVNYRPPPPCHVRQIGLKREMLEKMLFEQACQETEASFDKLKQSEPVEIEEYKSITHKDYQVAEFESCKPTPTAAHDYVSEQPATFWSEHKDKIHGTSQCKTHDTSFRKNAAFSSPLGEYWDQPRPYEDELIPKM